MKALEGQRLGGAHIVPVLELGTDESTGTPFVLTPAVRGRSLADILDEHSPIEPATVVRIALDVARALSDAQERGVLHGTLTPADVFLEETSDVVVTRVAGFGFREALRRAGVEREGFVLERDGYAAPETFSDADGWSHQADLWSVGAMLYQSLSAKLPFGDSADKASWQQAVLEQELKPIQAVAPWIDADLARIVHGLLLPNTAMRCPSSAELEAALRQLDMAVDLLTSDMLHTVGDRRRTIVASRASLPRSWSDVRSTVVDGSAQKLVGATLSGRYRVSRVLGVGGMGAVYESTTEDGGTFAVKVIRSDGSFRGTEARRRFLREARSAESIRHPNVVRVIEAGHDEEKDLPFIVMELLHGDDLGHFVDGQGPMDPSIAARVFADASRGLEAAHVLGMIHRDIKPPNLFLHEQPDGVVVPKLCDFGIAKQDMSLREHSSTVLTETGGLLGSPLYMSPEQAENAKQASARSDVWSMAISLYETLCGTSPWSGCSTIGEVMLCLYTKEIPQLTDLAPWVDPKLAAVVHRGLQRSSDERYASAAAFADALEPFAAPSPLTVETVRAVDNKHRSAGKLALDALPGASTARNKTTRRSRTKALSALAVLVVFGLGGGVYYGSRTTNASVVPVDSETVDPSPPPSIAPVSAEASAVSAVLRIEPADAIVRIDDVPVDVTDGGVRIERRPGETVKVEVRVGDAGIEERVVVTSDGKTVPPKLVVAPVAEEPPTTVKRSGGKAASPASTTHPVGPDPVPTAAGSGQKGPKFNTEW